MICFRDDKTIIEHLAAAQAICCSWEGAVSSQHFQQGMQLNLHYLRSLVSRNWIVDIRLMAAISYDDQQWLLEKWIPAIWKLHLRKVAIIQSFNGYNNMVIEDLLRYTPETATCEVQLFADQEASLDWIQDFSQGIVWGKTNIA